jgi:hypothetical protein
VGVHQLLRLQQADQWILQAAFMVVIIIAMKSNIKLIEAKAIWLLSISLSFFSLAYHSIIHTFSFLYKTFTID